MKGLRDRITWIAGAAALLVSVLALGGVPRWALGAATLLAGAAVAAQLPSRRGFERWSPLLAVLATMVGLTALQAVPLPQAISQALAPTTAELIEDSRRLLGEDVGGWRPLTVDAAGTWRELTLAVLLLAVGFVALRLGSSERGRFRLQAAVGGVAALAALIVGVHQLTGATSLYGFYAPAQASTRLLGPLLNPNHLASLMVVGALTCGGLALYARQPLGARAFWLVASLGCVAVALTTRSRGAAIALGAGAVVGLAGWLAQRRNNPEDSRRVGRWTTVPLAAVVLCAFALVINFSGAEVASDLDGTTTGELDSARSKFAAWRASEALIRESPWIGVGHGGFEPAFTRVFPAASMGTFSHVENQYLQAVIDWGVPGALLLAAGLGWMVVVMLRRVRGGPLGVGALAALAAVAVHSTVDFGLELPGLAVPVVMLAATLVYVPLRTVAPARRRRSQLARAAMLVACVGGVVLVVPAWGRTVAEDHAALAGQPPLAAALDAMRRHPLDYYAAGQAAVAASREGDPRAIRLLNHALALHPTHVGLHRQAARMLRRAGRPAQATLEYTIALRGSEAPEPLLGEIVGAFPDDAVALRALPIDHAQPFRIGRHLVAVGRGALAVAYYQRIIERQPERLDVADALLKLATAQDQLDVVEAVARDLIRRQPTLARRLALARALEQRGALAEVVTVLDGVERATGERVDRFAAWNLRCEALAATAAVHEAQACLIGILSSELATDKNRDALEARLLRLRTHVEGAAPPPTAPPPAALPPAGPP